MGQKLPKTIKSHCCARFEKQKNKVWKQAQNDIFDPQNQSETKDTILEGFSRHGKSRMMMNLY